MEQVEIIKDVFAIIKRMQDKQVGELTTAIKDKYGMTTEDAQKSIVAAAIGDVLGVL